MAEQFPFGPTPPGFPFGPEPGQRGGFKEKFNAWVDSWPRNRQIAAQADAELLFKWIYLRGLGISYFAQGKYEPVFMNEGVPKELENVGLVSVSIPFGYREQRSGFSFRQGEPEPEKMWYPAVKSLKARKWKGGVDYPIVKMTMFDPIAGKYGDEVIELEMSGKIGEEGQPITAKWRMWEPDAIDKDELVLQGSPRGEIQTGTKPASELTLDDVVVMLINRVRKVNPEVELVPNHVRSALMMVGSKSAAWVERLKEMSIRSEFNAHLSFRGDKLSLMVRQVVRAPKPEFRKFLEDVDEGRIKNYTEWKKAIREIPGGTVGGGLAVLPAVIHGALDIVPNRRRVEELAEYPTDLFVSALGLEFWNQLMNKFQSDVQPKLIRSAELVAEVQASAIDAMNEGLRIKVSAWKLLKQELIDNEKNMTPQIRAKARAMLADIEKQIEQMEGPIVEGQVRAIDEPPTNPTRSHTLNNH